MDEAFPFGFPPATAGYLTLYTFTLVIHVLFMNYVLAGTTYLAIVSLFTGGFDMGFNLVSFIVAVLGAVILLAIVNLIFGRK